MKKFIFNNFKFNEKGAGKVLGPLESEVMECLWNTESMTISQIRDSLKKNSAFNTVMTIVHRLVDKGLVKRTKEGRTSWYKALYTKETFMNNLSKNLVQELFGRNAPLSVNSFSDIAQKLDKETLKTLKHEIDDLLSKK